MPKIMQARKGCLWLYTFRIFGISIKFFAIEIFHGFPDIPWQWMIKLSIYCAIYGNTIVVYFLNSWQYSTFALQLEL